MPSTESSTPDWPVLKRYDQAHLRRIALPLGGIGTGTVSLGGRGDLRDWELMNRPAKGFIPQGLQRSGQPFFALNLQTADGRRMTRALEGPLEWDEYEGANGSPAPNHGLPRFSQARFEAAYPFGQVHLADPSLPVQVTLQAFNPLVPVDLDASSLPLAVLRFQLTNRSDRPLTAAVCASLPNFIGMDGSLSQPGFAGAQDAAGARNNRNRFHHSPGLQGLYLSSSGVDPTAEAWGTMALATLAEAGVSYRTTWATGTGRWGNDLLDFWEDFDADGALQDLPVHPAAEEDLPMASLAVRLSLPPGETHPVTFLLAWHFPNRSSWTLSADEKDGCCAPADRLQNYYTTLWLDAWDVLEKNAPRLADLEARSLAFVRALTTSSLPDEVKEAALFNLSTLRSQTCFRTADGRFYAWEGCGDHAGCCHGSCTHVWNYEQATAFLFGDLAKIMREIEFDHATTPAGLMSFRVNLPLERASQWGTAAADGQMGCIMKVYREWQLSGDDAFLRRLWPNVRQALAFCWLEGSWDADRDGVMEGCQHNTMDVEYFGPNPQMESWYLGALRAVEEMARALGETALAADCRHLFEQGSRWTDKHLFNGEYYQHEIRPIPNPADILPGLMVGMGAHDLGHPDYQLGHGCLVDQLVGQMMAHVCGLGYLLDRRHVRKALHSIRRYNRRIDFQDHFNCMRSYVLGHERALLMAAYPRERPDHPFPYFSEVMTGFEYTAAVGMLYEGQTRAGLRTIRDVRARYDGRKRSPFDEAECGHHYARAMAAWGAVLALTGFHYSAVDGSLQLAAQAGQHFWSTGYAWGTCRLQSEGAAWTTELEVLGGELRLQKIALAGAGVIHLGAPGRQLAAGQCLTLQVPAA